MTTAQASMDKTMVSSFPNIQGHIRNKGGMLFYKRLQAQLGAMEERMYSACGEEGNPIADNLRRMIASGGKRLRPALAWVCYRLAGKEKAEILPLMCMLEMMHTASLIHDDVVDDAAQRRNTPTIHTRFGTLFAVQCGDFLLAKAMEYLHIYRGMGINEVLSDTSRQMCLGEFAQMEGLYSLKKQTMERYYVQIRRKTAYLLAASCYCGALAGGMDAEQAETLRLFGEYLGMAFQLEDDILDFAPDAKTGKTAGQDIKNGIFTMPVLSVMREYPDEEITALLEKRLKTEKEIERILEYVERNGGVRHTREQIVVCSQKAVDSLNPLPDTTEKRILSEMVHKLIERRS